MEPTPKKVEWVLSFLIDIMLAPAMLSFAICAPSDDGSALVCLIAGVILISDAMSLIRNNPWKDPPDAAR
jgi:hypothetical protein